MYTEAFCVNEYINQYAVDSRISNIDKHIDSRLINAFIWKPLTLFVDCMSYHRCIDTLKPFHILLIRDKKHIIS